MESSVLNLKNAATDAAYLRTLLNLGYKNGHIMHWTFISIGIHLTTDPEVYKALLHHQNTYLYNILVLSVEGTSQDANWQDIEIEG
eukprot:1867519-Ditylum_brightwellii.AAC.1